MLSRHSAMQGNKVAKFCNRCHSHKTQPYEPWRLTMVRVLPPFKRASLVLRFTGPAIDSLDKELLPALVRPLALLSKSNAFGSVLRTQSLGAAHHCSTCMCVDFAVAGACVGNLLHARDMKGLASSLYMPCYTAVF